jgi:hypothetical protein
MVEQSGSWRLFQPVETLWWDGTEAEQYAIFEADNIQFRADLHLFLASLRIPAPPKEG